MQQDELIIENTNSIISEKYEIPIDIDLDFCWDSPNIENDNKIPETDFFNSDNSTNINNKNMKEKSLIVKNLNCEKSIKDKIKVDISEDKYSSNTPAELCLLNKKRNIKIINDEDFKKNKTNINNIDKEVKKKN